MKFKLDFIQIFIFFFIISLTLITKEKLEYKIYEKENYCISRGNYGKTKLPNDKIIYDVWMTKKSDAGIYMKNEEGIVLYHKGEYKIYDDKVTFKKITVIRNNELKNYIIVLTFIIILLLGYISWESYKTK
jgi:hypothetical protein